MFASSQAGEEPLAKAEADIWKHVAIVLRWTFPLLAAVLLFLVLRHVLALEWLSLSAYVAERRKRRTEAEDTYSKQFRKASLSDDPRATFRHIMRWLDRVDISPLAPTLRQFASESGMPDLANATRELESAVFAPDTRTEWSEIRRRW